MLFRLDFQSAVPIYRQIRDQVVLAVAQGELTPGERLPTTRALAEDAGVNVMTVSKAYQLLKAEGYLVTDRRAGAVVRAPRGKAAGLSADQTARLKLLAGEARLAGLTLDDFVAACKAAFTHTAAQPASETARRLPLAASI